LRGCAQRIWSGAWVNNYVQGRSPAPFDVLFWNADTTRMPTALHRDMVHMGVHNSLTEPGGVTMLGTPVDLATVTADTYVVAGIADHISPWQACYRSARLLGSKDSRFVLSTSGHIAALVNPLGNPKASYRVGGIDEPDQIRWLEAANSTATPGGPITLPGWASAAAIKREGGKPLVIRSFRPRTRTRDVCPGPLRTAPRRRRCYRSS
jgi:poly(3-hydroxyalkanoate) synthetase